MSRGTTKGSDEKQQIAEMYPNLFLIFSALFHLFIYDKNK